MTLRTTVNITINLKRVLECCGRRKLNRSKVRLCVLCQKKILRIIKSIGRKNEIPIPA